MIPPDGDDIIWPNTAAAYLDLPEPLRMLADNLWAVHCSAHDCTVTRHAIEMDTQQFDNVFTGIICETTCPVVRVHPETGERLLVLGNSVQNFVGLEKYSSQKLFDRLQSYLTARENTVCWSWKSGDVVIWDNRATERYANPAVDIAWRGASRDENMPPCVVVPPGVGTKSKPHAPSRLVCVH
ncbi:TauD/TfdA family dioxygenase [Bradyrhizobium sp. 151]|uniref:TauD/TfdA dioxygenase family protein n=1 Tax=Bradyrhizobium sp. 151 TaxID=2782626 RepID=UPI00320B35AF